MGWRRAEFASPSRRVREPAVERDDWRAGNSASATYQPSSQRTFSRISQIRAASGANGYSSTRMSSMSA